MLGLPFALAHAGWAGLVLILLMTFLAANTSKMVVASFRTTNERKRANPELLGKGYVTNYDDLAARLGAPRAPLTPSHPAASAARKLAVAPLARHGAPPSG